MTARKVRLPWFQVAGEILPQAAHGNSSLARSAGKTRWRLAARAEVAAASGDKHASDSCRATRAGPAVTMIDAVAPLVAAGITFRIDEIRDGRSAQPNGRTKHFAHRVAP